MVSPRPLSKKAVFKSFFLMQLINRITLKHETYTVILSRSLYGWERAKNLPVTQ